VCPPLAGTPIAGDRREWGANRKENERVSDDLSTETHGEWPRAAAVIGAGTMGLGVAGYFAAAGLEVRLVDATPDLTREAARRLVERARGYAEAELLSAEAAARVAASVEAAGSLSGAVRGTDLVFEAVPEDLGLKEEILGECSGEAPTGAVIASNTSSLPMDELSRFVGRPERFLGMHWFNPPEWTPGVEVIPAASTDPGVVERVVRFLSGIGKRPAVVGSGPGFVANRIQMALFLEAVRCVEEGLASPQEVDEVVRSCFGFRYPFFGPFQIADMAGLDVYASVLKTLEEGLGGRFETPGTLSELVKAGRTGTKSGAGFLEYGDEERARLLLERDRRYAALGGLLDELPPVEAGREEGGT
jgi:3-hydroxybutyryl-CoA dehydrogenase